MKYRKSAGKKKEREEKAFSSMTKRMDFHKPWTWERNKKRKRRGGKRIAEKRRGIFVRKWHGFPGFGISIRNIGRRWLEGGGTAARNLEFPLVIKSYPLQSGNTRHCRCCGKGEYGMERDGVDEDRAKTRQERISQDGDTEGSQGVERGTR